MLDAVAQLAHVAGPRLGAQPCEGGRRQAAHRAALVGGDRAREVLGQGVDVVAAIAQRRQRQAQRVEAVVEVGAEPAGFDVGGEVAVGRRDHADVDGELGAGTDGPDGALLEGAQELGLQAARQLADLVEEDGAAVGLGEQAGAIGAGVGERAAHVAEQLALEQRLGQRGAVDRDEGAGGAAAQAVQAARGDLLAGAALAVDQHVGAGAGEAREQRAHHVHRGARSDQLGEHRADGARLGLLPAGLQHAAGEAVEGERLGEEVDGAGAHRGHGAIDRARAAHHQHVERGPLPQQLGAQLDAVGASEVHVEEHHVDVAAIEAVARDRRGDRQLGGHVASNEAIHDGLCEELVVVDHQHTHHQ